MWAMQKNGEMWCYSMSKCFQKAPEQAVKQWLCQTSAALAETAVMQPPPKTNVPTETCQSSDLAEHTHTQSLYMHTLAVTIQFFSMISAAAEQPRVKDTRWDNEKVQ